MLIMVKRPGLRSFFCLQQREDMASSPRIQEPEIIEPNTLRKTLNPINIYDHLRGP